VWIPSLLQSLTNGADKVVVSGATVGEIIDNLEARFPGIKDRLVQGGEIRPHIAVAIDGDVSPGGPRARRAGIQRNPFHSGAERGHR
jgi:molybdopterin converting factor small subunit